MGREVRRVPPNWEHPQAKTDGWRHTKGYQPMYDQRFEDRFAEWLAEFDRIRAGNLTEIERECYPTGLAEWLSDDGVAPDPAYYRPWTDEEATWFQVWETVSEGTPVTPPFATKAELVDYLATNGDFWDQKRGDGSWSRDSAERFVKDEWAPSMIATAGQVYAPRDGMPP
jgi:hypothetical protein